MRFLLIVLIIAGLASIVSFAVPGYQAAGQRDEAREALATELARPERCVLVAAPLGGNFLIIPPPGAPPPPTDYTISYLCGKDIRYFPDATGEVANPLDEGEMF